MIFDFIKPIDKKTIASADDATVISGLKPGESNDLKITHGTLVTRATANMVTICSLSVNEVNSFTILTTNGESIIPEIKLTRKKTKSCSIANKITPILKVTILNVK